MKTIDFVSKRKLFLKLSIIANLLAIFFILTRGMNYGIDFAGGTLVEIRAESAVDIAKLRGDLEKLGLGEVTIQALDANKDVLIRYGGKSDISQEEAVSKVKGTLASSLGEVEYRKVDFVGPQVGSELIKAGIIAVLLAFVGIFLYVWSRFEWQFAVGGILAMTHDVLITAGVYSIFQIEFNTSSIAALLTILGYSINDTVVIFDRIREYREKMRKESLEKVINISINSTLGRTILTSGTTIAAIIALLVAGGPIVHGFAIAMCVGVFVGTYSSMYIASPSLLFFKLKTVAELEKAKEDRAKEELRRYGG
jgi:preprotein translocase subunit SecF